MKRTVHSNHRIEVRPDTTVRRGFYRQSLNGVLDTDGVNREMAARCEEIRRAVLKHVDGLALAADNYTAPGAVRVMFDSRDECSFCSREWEELTQSLIDESAELGKPDEWFEDPVDGPGLPLCCDAAQQEWREQRRSAA